MYNVFFGANTQLYSPGLATGLAESVRQYLLAHVLQLKIQTNTLQEYSRSFEDVSSNTVIYFRGIPKEFRGNMTVLLEISDKDPLYSHCYQVKH